MAKKSRKFKTDVQQLLDLVTHSLYSKKEIFLRELISNASDAIDRVQFEALTNKKLLGKKDQNWKIRITADEEAK
ncbi:MAG: molecular chaperone HtpG, partial [Kiritimatiellia bacterium]|nr:molecular chaperone HtpG [Kiritimatiellia bacterium]